MSRSLLFFGVLLLGLVSPRSANAHDPYETTTTILVHSERIDVTMVMARSMVEALFGRKNAPISGGVWKEAPSLQGLYTLSSRGDELELKSSQATRLLEGPDEGDFVFDLGFSAPPGGELSVRALYLEKLEQGYTGVVQVVEADSGELLDIKVLHASDPLLKLTVPKSSIRANAVMTETAESSSMAHARPLGTFLWVGIEHVVFGYDHLLFLLSVLLACAGFRQVFGILSAFTLAHSVTLSLAALHVIPLVNDIVEPIIAASIAVAAFWGKSLESRGLLLPMTFVFGLIHGLGFAAGLEVLADAGNVRLLGLLGFNSGVELGQIAAAAVLLSVLTFCRRSSKGEHVRLWAARSVGVIGAAIFAWRIVVWS